MDFVKRNFKIRAESNDETKTARITGRPIVYDSKTDLGFCDEIMERGALDKTDLSDVRFFVNHNIDGIPFARFRKGNPDNTMLLSVDKTGMEINADLDVDNNAEARALYSAVKRGDISGMSFMFSIDDEEWEDLKSNHPTRHIKSIGKVVEVSAVAFPAYESTEITARDKKLLEAERKKVLNTNSENSEFDLIKLKAKFLYQL